MEPDMQRVCFRLQVQPERMDEYRLRHHAVWPEMLEALAAAGWQNYSLFLDTDGMLIGYFETVSLEDALARMNRTEVNERWQSEMSPFFVNLKDAPDRSFTALTEVFNLESQIAASTRTARSTRIKESS